MSEVVDLSCDTGAVPAARHPDDGHHSRSERSLRRQQLSPAEGKKVEFIATAQSFGRWRKTYVQMLGIDRPAFPLRRLQDSRNRTLTDRARMTHV